MDYYWISNPPPPPHITMYFQDQKTHLSSETPISFAFMLSALVTAVLLSVQFGGFLVKKGQILNCPKA